LPVSSKARAPMAASLKRRCAVPRGRHPAPREPRPLPYERRLAARLERQEILARESPSHLWFLMDEAVLRRGIGGPRVMGAQLLHVEETSHHPRLVIQIVPSETGAHAGLLGAFVIATNNADTVYLETAAAWQITEMPSVVEEITLTWEALRSETLPRGASRDLIAYVVEERWT
jgi:Domain of unknown function (DUF5753)